MQLTDLFIYLFVYSSTCIIYSQYIEIQIFLNWFLNESVLLESTTGVGSEFHTAIIRLENKNFCTLVFITGTVIFSGWPRKFLYGFKVKKSLLIETLSCNMLYAIVWSAIKRLCSRLCSFRRDNRSA